MIDFLKNFLVGPLMGAAGGGKRDPEAQKNADIKSLFANHTPPQPVQAQPVNNTKPPVDGFDWKQIGKDIISQGADAAIGSVIDPFKAKTAGKAQRKFVDKAFPELGPWEKAGVATGGIGQATSEQRNAQKLQKQQFDQQRRLQADSFKFQTAQQQRQLKVAADMNAVSSDAQVTAAALNSEYNRSRIPMQTNIDRATYQRVSEEVWNTYQSGKGKEDSNRWARFQNLDRIVYDYMSDEINGKEALKRLTANGVKNATSALQFMAKEAARMKSRKVKPPAQMKPRPNRRTEPPLKSSKHSGQVIE